MKKRMTAFLLSLLLFAAHAGAETPIVVNPDSAPQTAEETAAMVAAIVKEAMENEELGSVFADEVTVVTEAVPSEWFPGEPQTIHTLSHGGMTLRYLEQISGEADESGRYPLYIALHGGGGGSEEMNNDQWINMLGYYGPDVENGIYLSVRGVSDTWDLHFREETYPLLDALISYMTAAEHADPNHVYLLGFSAGGDGVYQLSPRLADRFAAVNMSSGHPNGVSLLNLANCPICLQAGIRDYYSEDGKRSVRCAEFEKTLNEYRNRYGFGYEHQVWIHVPEGHQIYDFGNVTPLVLADPEAFAEREEPENMLSAMKQVALKWLETDDVATLSYWLYGDSEPFDRDIALLVRDDFSLELTEANTSAVTWVSRYVRNPAPAEVVWDLGTRAASREITSWYWLEAEPSVNAGIIRASFDSSSNTYTVTPDEAVNGDFAIRFLAGMVDTGRPVRIVTPEGEYTLQVNPSEELAIASFLERADPDMVCVGKILYSELK
ncbi:MAG: hypothetical protein IJK06_02375 [Clostridia bacterium]|nr:hypothetical protein [Clostridia bacterium]